MEKIVVEDAGLGRLAGDGDRSDDSMGGTLHGDGCKDGVAWEGGLRRDDVAVGAEEEIEENRA